MKKILMSLMTIVFIVLLSGCSLLKNITKKVPLDNPKINSIGNIIIWESIQGAESYDIYINDSFHSNTIDNYIIIDEIAEQSTAYIIAKDKEEKRNSQKSNECILHKNTNFTSDEVKIIELQNNCNYIIEEKIKYVEINGTAKDCFIKLEHRYTDIVIKLNNVNLLSAEGENCISTYDKTYDVEKNPYTVMIQLEGENVLIGSDYTQIPSTPNSNTEENGIKGGDGGSCLVLPNIIFSGSGNLHLDAGNGGQGGKGAASADWANKWPGCGGDGGDGGNGISCTNFILNLEKGHYIEAFGGIGGQGGSHGVNGSATTGPWLSMSGKLDSMNGKKGSNGFALLGNKKIYSGIFKDEKSNS